MNLAATLARQSSCAGFVIFATAIRRWPEKIATPVRTLSPRPTVIEEAKTTTDDTDFHG
jgi:hypothetical protein